jgi:hypothetical protein
MMSPHQKGIGILVAPGRAMEGALIRARRHGRCLQHIYSRAI